MREFKPKFRIDQLMVAKLLEPGLYADGTWHSVYSYALDYFGIA